MKVTTVRLPDDLAEAVAEAADDTERSQSEYIRHVLRTHFDSKPDTPAVEDDDDRLAELEARVEALEERFDRPEPDAERGGQRGVSESPERSATTSDTVETRNVSSGTVEDDDAVRAAVREAIGDGAPRKSHAREALVDAVALLADRGALATGDLKDELYPRYEAEYSTKRTMWNSLDRHLDGVPGVHKPEYGTWAVDVEALLGE
jgi:predicted transcriptional regulator